MPQCMQLAAPVKELQNECVLACPNSTAPQLDCCASAGHNGPRWNTSQLLAHAQQRGWLFVASRSGPEGAKLAQVLAEARRLGLLSVRGNHDDTALAAWEAHAARGVPPHGKRAWVINMTAADAAWLRGLPFSLRAPAHGLIIVHAGVVPDVRARQTLVVKP